MKRLFKTIRLEQGIDGAGNTVWIVTSIRDLKERRTLISGRHMEYFKTKSEAELWIKYALGEAITRD